MLRQIFAVAFLIFATSFTFIQASNGNYSHLDTIGDQHPAAALDVTSVTNIILDGSFTEMPSLGDITQKSDQYTYQFHDYGVVDVIITKTNGDLSYSNMLWDLEQSPDGVVLTISNPPTGSAFELTVEEVTTDYLIADFNGQSIKWMINPVATDNQIEHVENLLYGVWDASAYPFDIINDVSECGAFEKINGAYLSYEFYQNGMYVKKVGSQMVSMEEQGIWEVTKDGQFVLFHATVDGNPENVYFTQVAHIESVSDEALVLSQALSVPESDFHTLFCTAPKDFYLGKIESTSSLK